MSRTSNLIYRLKKVDVILEDPERIMLTCEHCGTSWSPDLGEKGRLPRGYWKCPNGCNGENGRKKV